MSGKRLDFAWQMDSSAFDAASWLIRMAWLSSSAMSKRSESEICCARVMVAVMSRRADVSRVLALFIVCIVSVCFSDVMRC